MNALTLHQPWASLIAHDVKKIETRSWAPPRQMIGQRIAIHAGKRVVRGSLSWGTRKAIADLYGPEWWDPAIPVGSVVCTAVLADVRRVIGHSQGVAQLTASLAGDHGPHRGRDRPSWRFRPRPLSMVSTRRESLRPRSRCRSPRILGVGGAGIAMCWGDCETMQCPGCDGSGEILVCVNDMCRGQGWCMHGDGDQLCPDCRGEGEFERRWPEVKSGDFFTEGVEALVNPVNCLGVMGRGLARAFKHKYPENFRAYRSACLRGAVRPGEMFVYETGLAEPRWIVNFPTKRDWRDPSRLEDIDLGLKALVRELCRRDIHSIAVPALGCGLGELRWADVFPLLIAGLSGFRNVRVVLFKPRGR